MWASQVTSARTSAVVTVAYGDQQRSFRGRGGGSRGGGRGGSGRGRGGRGGRDGAWRPGRGQQQDVAPREDGGWKDSAPRDGGSGWQDAAPSGGGGGKERAPRDSGGWKERASRGDGAWKERAPRGGSGGWKDGAPRSDAGGGWKERAPRKDVWEERRGGYDPRADNFFSDDDAEPSFSDARGGGGYGSARSPRGGRRGGQWESRDARPSRDSDEESWSQRDRGAETPAPPSFKDLWIGDALYGVSPVLAALEAGRRTPHTLYVQDALLEGSVAGRKDKTAVAAAVARAKELGAVVRPAAKHDLNMVCDNRPHQGLVLDASELDFEGLEAMPAAADVHDGVGPPPIWLCLDEVVDPQNFGAALRSAFFLGAAGVLTCRRNSAPLSPVVSKASAGAMELMPIYSCRSLPQTLADARAKGWTVVGAAAVPEAVPASTYRAAGPTLLVMGNEGYGLRTTVRQQCDTMLRIDGGSGRGGAAAGLGAAAGERARRLAGLVDSLNVSVATGILMHQLLHPEGAGEGQ